MTGASSSSRQTSCVLVERMWQRVGVARNDSDTALFFDLLYMGEVLVKLVVVGMLAGLPEDRDRHRYRLEYQLVRANAIGDWAAVLDDLLTGPASPLLLDALQTEKREVTQYWTSAEDTWQQRAVDRLEEVCRVVDQSVSARPFRVSLRRWFQNFVWLRNRTRGHGAVTGRVCSVAAPALESSLQELSHNLNLLRRPWVYLRRNLSVIPVAGTASECDYLKSEPNHRFQDGLYLVVGTDLHPVHLMQTDVDLSDFYFANGGFNGTNYELLSYITDDRQFADATPYLIPSASLPQSETEGRPHLEVQGQSFANTPPRLPDYIRRIELERQLQEVLLDDRHPIITLVGRGGIGKTSLALEVLHQLADEGHFFAIVWFSARDIDLLPEGPKLVKPHVLTPDEIAREFVELMDPAEAKAKGFKAIDFLAACMSGRASSGPFLFVFDNFETVRSPAELYQTIDTYIRLPNKVLLTSRFRDFKADYPVEVRGMTRPEFNSLVEATATRLRIGHLIREEYLTEVYEESDGHPYVVKVLLGELARNPKVLVRFAQGRGGSF